MNTMARRVRSRMYHQSTATEAAEGASGTGQTERLLASYGVRPAQEGN